MTIIAFLMGLCARTCSFDMNDPVSWLILILGIAMIFIETWFWIK